MQTTTIKVRSLTGSHIGKTITFRDRANNHILGKLVGVKLSSDYRTCTLFLDQMDIFVLPQDHELELFLRS